MFQLSLLKKDILKDSMLSLLVIRIIQSLWVIIKHKIRSDCNNSQNSKLKRFIEVHVIYTQSLVLSKQIKTKCCLTWLKIIPPTRKMICMFMTYDITSYVT